MTQKLGKNVRRLMISLMSFLILSISSISAWAICEYPYYEKECVIERMAEKKMHTSFGNNLEWVTLRTNQTLERLKRILKNKKAAGNKSQEELWKEVTFSQRCFLNVDDGAAFNRKHDRYLVRVLEGFEGKEAYIHCNMFYGNQDGTACFAGFCENGFQFKEQPEEAETFDSAYVPAYHIPDELEYTREN